MVKHSLSLKGHAVGRNLDMQMSCPFPGECKGSTGKQSPLSCPSKLQDSFCSEISQSFLPKAPGPSPSFESQESPVLNKRLVYHEILRIEKISFRSIYCLSSTHHHLPCKCLPSSTPPSSSPSSLQIHLFCLSLTNKKTSTG